MKKTPFLLAALLLSSLLFSGCATTVTNLTPSTLKRTPGGLYPFEVAWDSRDHLILPQSLKPSVVIGSSVYPMQSTLGIENRWETLVPIPADKEYVNYRFKFDYEVRKISTPKPGSKLSDPYQVHIVDK